MRRASAGILLTLLVFASAGLASAAPDKCIVAPADPSTRAMALELRQGSKHRVFQAGKGASFPAVSEDGATLVELFTDGSPEDRMHTTVVFWSNTGQRLAMFSLGTFAEGGPKDSAGDAAWQSYEAKVLADANARLTKTKWRPLAKHLACGDRKLHLDDGVTLSFDTDNQQIVRELGGGKTKVLAGKFPVIATNDVTGDECARPNGFAQGFGGDHVGVAVVTATHHGRTSEMCYEKPSGGVAIAVPLH
jgi:hypothetical protein